MYIHVISKKTFLRSETFLPGPANKKWLTGCEQPDEPLILNKLKFITT